MKALILLISFFFLTGFDGNFKNFSLPRHEPDEPFSNTKNRSKPRQTQPKARPQEIVPVAVSSRNYADSGFFAKMQQPFSCDNQTDEDKCEVCNCYREGRGESRLGQINIQRVVYTRMMSGYYPSTVCKVVYQPYQFSWTLKAKLREPFIGPNSDGFNGCVQAMAEAKQYEGTWFGSNFHATSVRPDWASTCKGRNQVGNHIFYVACGIVRPRTNYPEGYGKKQEDAISMNRKVEFDNEI